MRQTMKQSRATGMALLVLSAMVIVTITLGQPFQDGYPLPRRSGRG